MQGEMQNGPGRQSPLAHTKLYLEAREAKVVETAQDDDAAKDGSTERTKFQLECLLVLNRDAHI